MTCRQEAGWYRGIDMIVPLHVLCEGIFLSHVASDRARRPDVPRHIFYCCCKTHVWIWVFREADGYAIIEALSEFLTGFSCVRSESFCAWFCEMIFCQLCPNFWGVRGAYVDEIRVRLAENQPQKRVQKRLREYILSCARLNLPAPVFSTLSAVHDCLSAASPSCLYHYIRWNTPLNPSSDNSHLLDFQILFADYIFYILTQSRQTINQKNLTQSL